MPPKKNTKNDMVPRTGSGENTQNVRKLVLDKKWGLYVGKAQEVIGEVKNLIEGVSQPPDSAGLRRILVKLDSLKRNLSELHQERLAITPEGEIEAEVESFFELEITLSESSMEINEKLNESVSALSEINNKDKIDKKSPILPRLPELKLSPFTGDPLKWTEFWEQFNSAINENEGLNPASKFQYLKSLMKDEAGRTLEGMAVSSANYPKAIDLLKERYGNPQRVIFSHFNKLFRIGQASDDTNKLRWTHDECEKHILGLEALGVGENQYGIVFVPLILSKLPDKVQLEMNRKRGSQDWNLGLLRKLLKEELNAREAVEGKENKLIESGNGVNYFKKKWPNSDHKNIKSNSMLVSQTQNKKPIKCVYCGKDHFLIVVVFFQMSN